MCLALAALVAAAPAHANDVSISGYVDGELQAVQVPAAGGDTEWSNSFGNASDALFWIKGTPSDEVSAMAEIDYRQSTNTIAVWQAMVDWQISGEQATLRLGKFYFPFGIEYGSLYSTTNPLVSRPFRTNDAMLAGFAAPFTSSWQDNGVALHGMLDMGGEGMGIHYALAIANGLNGMGLAAANTDGNDNKAVGGKVSLTPQEGVEVGGSFTFGKYGVSPLAPVGTTDEENYMLFGGHVMVDMIENFSLDGEFRMGSVSHEAAGVDDNKMMAWYATAAYRVDTPNTEFIELAARVGSVDPNTDADDDQFMQVSVGASCAPVENLRFKTEFQINQEGDNVAGPGAGSYDNNEFLFQAVFGW